MKESKTRTRPPSAAERLAARALGQDEPEEITEDGTPSAVLHAQRLEAPGKSPKPKGTQTWDWYAERDGQSRAGDGPDAA